MQAFRRLGASRSVPPGLEWSVLKKLPRVFLYGTLALGVSFLIAQSEAIFPDTKQSLILQYTLLGTLLFHWMSVLCVGLYCVIISIMKGPAYVMDPYFLPEEKQGHSQSDIQN